MTRATAALACLAWCSMIASCDRSDRDAAAGSGTASRPAEAGAANSFAMVDVSGDSGITFVTRTGDATGQQYIPEAKGAGVALLDYDVDGVLDVFLVSGSTVDRERDHLPGFGSALYRGLGGLRYADVTEAAKVPALGWSNAPIAGDLDGNGFPDLLVTGLTGMRLLANDHAVFHETTSAALPPSAANAGWCTSGVLFDADQDGDLDAFVARYLKFDVMNPPNSAARAPCRWKGQPVICGPRGFEPLHAILLRNRGDGTFEDVTKAFGIHAVPPGFGLGALSLDFNQDGRPDVYAANDMTPSHLWRNDGDRFAEVGVALGVAYSADGSPEAGMGVDAGDLNGDGIEDLVKTNFDGETNDFYLSSKTVGYDEASARVGAAATDRPHVGWGCAIRDFDGDGINDVFVANGHVYPQADAPMTGTTWAQPKVLHRGTSAGRFARFAGPGSEALSVAKVSRGAAFGDLDDDGDVDVIVVNVNARPTILRTDTPRGPWLGIALSGPPRNPQALGATVTVSGDGFRRSQFVRAQASFESTNDPRALFRLRASETPKSIEVSLPGRPTLKVDRIQPGAWQRVDLR